MPWRSVYVAPCVFYSSQDPKAMFFNASDTPFGCFKVTWLQGSEERARERATDAQEEDDGYTE